MAGLKTTHTPHPRWMTPKCVWLGGSILLPTACPVIKAWNWGHIVLHFGIINIRRKWRTGNYKTGIKLSYTGGLRWYVAPAILSAIDASIGRFKKLPIWGRRLKKLNTTGKNEPNKLRNPKLSKNIPHIGQRNKTKVTPPKKHTMPRRRSGRIKNKKHDVS